MLQEKIVRQSRRIARNDRASYAFSRAATGRKYHRRFYLYLIYPPASTPFLPSDEALKTLVGTIPDMRFLRSSRYADRDYFAVYGGNKNILTTRAKSPAREVRNSFLEDVASASLEERIIPAYVQEACQAFLSDCGFASILWDGKQAIAHDAEMKRYEGSRITGGTYWRPFRNVERVCRPILPFYLEAAPP